MEFAQEFGRAEVYQLALWDGGAPRRETSAHIHGRFLFGEELTYGKLASRFAAGAQMKRTKITEEFTFEDFLARYGEAAIVMFVISESRQLKICTSDAPPAAQAGETVVALVDPQDDSDAG
jgi:hypothetical protein